MKKLLVLIIIIAAFLRFFQLSVNPPSLTWDEVAWGYNAYSLGIDGKDEFGRSLPYDYLESFGDFKPPMYAYLAIIPVKLFGLNEFAVRFPSAFFGTLTVLITYFLVRRIFSTSINANYYALSSVFLLAVSPWHIMLSRAAFEANISTFFIILGVWLFLEAVNKKFALLLLSVTAFAASIYTFNSARVVAPILLISLSLAYWKKLVSERKLTFLAILLGMLLILPTAKFLFSEQASLRFKEVNIFSDMEVLETVNQEIENDNKAWWSKVLHNRRFAYSKEVLKHYFDNLSFDFLFIKGDGNPKFSTGDVGQMYLWELPFFIIGVLFLIKRREGMWWVVPLWLIIGIIPASLARETPHALRTEGTLPTFQILSAYGLVIFLLWLKHSKSYALKFRKSILVFTFFVLFINIAYYFHGYYFHYPIEHSPEWQYGYRESIKYAQSVEDNYDNVEFTDSLGRPYIYVLFYTKYDPQKFREEAKVERDAFGFVHVVSFGKYKFPIAFSKNNKTLFIGTLQQVPKSANILKTFYNLNNSTALVAYTL